LGFSYDYIRLLSYVPYFIGHENEVDKGRNKSRSIHIDMDQTDTHQYIDSSDFPTVWLPEYWPKEALEKLYYKLLSLLDERYISDLALDKVYPVKSFTSCLFDAVQCVSTMLISCIRLQNINTVHTSDALSTLTSYMLFCVVIEA
jgi:hypothetical protein